MKKISLLAILCCFTSIVLAQKKIDGVVAIVGEKIVLQSAVESQLEQIKAQGYEQDEQLLKCQILEELLYQKLLANRAQIDSLNVSDEEINSAIDQRIAYFVGQIGSEQKLEEYFGKSINALREDFKPVFKEQMMAQRMESRITSDVKITPEDVRKFYYSIPKDSLPLLPAEMQMSQIVLFPKVSKAEKQRLTEKLLGFKNRVDSGEDFSLLATLYSEDQGSATKGGELGFLSRGVLVPEFEAAAFRLQDGEISDVVQTKFGFHLIQMISRRGEQINVRHILLKPSFSTITMNRAKTKLDSITNLIRIDSLSFEEAAYQFSQDDSKNNGGLLINPQTGTSSFAIEEIEPSIYFALEKMEKNQISEPLVFTSIDQRKGYRILFLNERTVSHRANLKDDYDRIRLVAEQELKNKTSKEWVNNTINETYILIKEDYQCTFKNNWK
jgi:peptidyl-prolyl cis-trans isomerase SurA